jgi:nitrite reductase/ring-hydroxylating ferredoxin subunit
LRNSPSANASTDDLDVPENAYCQGNLVVYTTAVSASDLRDGAIIPVDAKGDNDLLAVTGSEYFATSPPFQAILNDDALLTDKGEVACRPHHGCFGPRTGEATRPTAETPF